MNFSPRCTLRVLSLLAAGLCVLATSAGALTLSVRSGNAPAGNPDPLIRRLDLATSCGAGYPTPFAAAEFTAASAGPAAVVLSFIHPAWLPSMQCDALAAWVGTDANATPLSALYAIDVNVPRAVSRVLPSISAGSPTMPSGTP